MIRAIRFNRHDIYTADEAKGFFTKMVNRLHMTTRPGVVKREVLLREGEPYDSAAAAETERNLRRLGVFRQVRVDSVTADSGVALMVETQDAWSTRLDLSVRTTGGQSAYRASLFEVNLLGTASDLTVSYLDDPDRTSVLLGFSQPRLIRGRIGVAGFYENRSDGSIFTGQLYQPFLTLESRRSWAVTTDDRNERILRFFEGETTASDTVRRRLNAVALSYGWAPRAGKTGYVRIGVGGRVWQDDFLAEDSVLVGSRSTFGSLFGSVEWRRARFVVVRNFQATREEDLDLSTTLRAGLSLTPKGFGYRRDGLVPSVAAHTGALLGPRAFGYADLLAHGRFTAGGLDSGSVQTAATLVLLPAPRHTAFFNVSAGWLDDPRPGGEFDLGLGLGPRGYKLHAFTGDRAVFTSAEYRYLLGQDFLRLADLGVAGFVDFGGAWYSGSPHRTSWDYGLGLRIGSSRSTELALNRIDLVRRVGNDREPAGWVLVVGKGLVFSTSGILR